MKKIEEKKNLDTSPPPEDEAMCLSAGLIVNPDMVLNRYLILFTHSVHNTASNTFSNINKYLFSITEKGKAKERK